MLPLSPEVTDARGVERLFVRRGGDLGERGVAQFFQRMRIFL